MKKTIILFSALCLSGCYTHTNESVIGYNEKGQTIVKVCTSHGSPLNPNAYGSSCTVELRDYGRVTNDAHTINVISNDKR